MVTFNSDGSLSSFDYDGGATSLVIDPNNGASDMNIDLQAGTSGGYDGLTAYLLQQFDQVVEHALVYGPVAERGHQCRQHTFEHA